MWAVGNPQPMGTFARKSLGRNYVIRVSRRMGFPSDALFTRLQKAVLWRSLRLVPTDKP